MEYVVSLDYQWALDDHEAEALVEWLQPYSGSVHRGDDRTSLIMSVEATDVLDALSRAKDALDPELKSIMTESAESLAANGQWLDLLSKPRRKAPGLGSGHGIGLQTLVGIRVERAEDLERELEQPQIPPLGGVTDFADMLGLSRQRAWNITQRSDFPEPVVQMKTGPVWLRSQLETWAATHDRKPGRPRTVRELLDAAQEDVLHAAELAAKQI